jgi:hypothetical protein
MPPTIRVAFGERRDHDPGAMRADDPRREHRVAALTGAAREWIERRRARRLPTVHVAPPPDGPGPWTIGRADACRLVIDSATVSRRHAVVKRTGDGYEVRDLGSTNGTWVNGWRIDRATVRAGDVLEIGEVRVVLRNG